MNLLIVMQLLICWLIGCGIGLFILYALSFIADHYPRDKSRNPPRDGSARARGIRRSRSGEQ